MGSREASWHPVPNCRCSALHRLDIREACRRYLTTCHAATVCPPKEEEHNDLEGGSLAMAEPSAGVWLLGHPLPN